MKILLEQGFLAWVTSKTPRRNQNVPEDIQELCTETPAGNSNLNNEKLIVYTSEEFSSKGEVGTPASEKIS